MPYGEVGSGLQEELAGKEGVWTEDPFAPPEVDPCWMELGVLLPSHASCR